MSLPSAANGIINATTPLPWLVVAGQPTDSQFSTLHAAGVQRVIDIRDAMEPRPFDEPATTAALGMIYVNAPVVLGALTDAAMDRVLSALRSAQKVTTLLHCNSANRTGGPLIAFLVLDEGIAVQDAVDTAMRSGLRSAEILDWATDYVQRKEKTTSEK